MQKFESQINPDSADFSTNRGVMLEAITRFRAAEQKLVDSEHSKMDRYHQRGWLLPRERLSRLLDPGAPFVELCSLAGYRLFDDRDGSGAGGGAICGIGLRGG